MTQFTEVRDVPNPNPNPNPTPNSYPNPNPDPNPNPNPNPNPHPDPDPNQGLMPASTFWESPNGQRLVNLYEVCDH